MVAGQKLVWVPFVPDDEGVTASQDSQLVISADSGNTSALAVAESNASELLALPFGAFMRELLDNVDLHLFIETFLRYARRWFDCTSFTLSLDKDAMNYPLVRSRANVLRSVFVMLLRVVAGAPMDVEERTKYFPDSLALGRQLQQTGILNACQLMDICALYGEHNARLVRRVVRQTLQMMPDVADDLAAGFSQVCDLLYRVTDDVVAHERQRQSKELEDMTQYLVDILITLRSGLRAAGGNTCGFPNLSHSRALLVNLCAGYANYAVSQTSTDTDPDPTGQNFPIWRARLIAEATLDCVFLLLTSLYFAPLGVSEVSPETHADKDESINNAATSISSPTEANESEHDLQLKVEELIQIVAELLGSDATGGTFAMVADRHELFRFLDKVLATPHAINVDATRINYLKELCASIARPGPSSHKNQSSMNNIQAAQSATATTGSGGAKVKGGKQQQPTAKQRAVWSDAKHVSELHEVLPHLSKFFARKLLESVQGNVQQAVQCVLEDSLPAAMRGIQFDAGGDEDLVELDRGPDNMADLLDMGLVVSSGGGGGGSSGKTKMTRTSAAEVANLKKLDRDLDKLRVGDGDGNENAHDGSVYSGSEDEDEDDEEDEEEDEARTMRDQLKRFVSNYDQYEDEYDDTLDDGLVCVNDHGTDFAAESERPSRHERGGNDNNKSTTPTPNRHGGIQGGGGGDKGAEVQKWRLGMLDVDGKKRDAQGKIIKEEDEEDELLMRPNLNHSVAPPRPRGGRGFGRGGSRGGVAVDSATSEDTRTDEEKAKAARNKARRDNKNKSSRANHSRKAGAAKKANKGMM